MLTTALTRGGRGERAASRRRPPHFPAYRIRDSTSQRRRRGGSLDPPPAWVSGDGADEDRRDAVLAQPALEVDLLGVHEEGLVEAADRAEGLGREQQRRPDDPVDRQDGPRHRAGVVADRLVQHAAVAEAAPAG